MAINLIHDRGRGPEIIGTRITVYNLLPHFLDPTATESYICRLYDLTPDQVAAARAYVLQNPETVLAEHLRIEARLTVGNPPQVIEQATRTRETFLSFKKWLAERQRAATEEESAKSMTGNERNGSDHAPTFREWLAERETQPVEGP